MQVLAPLAQAICEFNPSIEILGVELPGKVRSISSTNTCSSTLVRQGIRMMEEPITSFAQAVEVCEA